MSKTYSCDLCKKEFPQKIDFTRHKNKKTPCISLSEIQEIIQAKEVKQDNKTELINIFKVCLNIMRDNEGLTGEKALRNMSYLLILKLIEPHFGNEIDIDNYDYPFDDYFGDDVIEENKKRLLHIIRFSNLSAEKEDDLPNFMEYAWNIILSNHPTTKNIFLKGKGFDIQRKTTYKKLINKINTIDLSNTEYDILGNAYEEVIQGIMTGKVFGQFFTMPVIKKLMVNLIDPQIRDDGTIETCCDPTMGTGGFLITYLQHILKQAQIKNIKPDWDFIKNEGLHGKEIDIVTYQLAVSNMLISSGHSFEQLENGDSIRDPITRKFDNILANPPFGIKGLKYDDFQSSLKNEYVPIKSDNAVSLFIQAIIYMLKINGKCAVVLPDGQDLSSKSNKTLVTVREFLMKTCDLKEIIYLPAGIFTYTNIKTCIFYFIKKQDGGDVLEFKDKVTRTQKVTGREYKFSKTHQTTVVKFYEYNQNKDEKFLLVEAPIEKIANNSYSLNYTEYTKEEKLEEEEEECDNEVIVKTLGEVCKFLSKSKRNAKYGNKEGLYPFFKSSTKVDSYVDEPDYEEESLIIGDGGEANINYGIKFSTSDHCYILQNKNNVSLNLKYAYYYLYHNLDMMNQLYTGVAIKNISKTNIEGIKISIPSLERQESIVKYLDFIYEKSIKTSQEKIKDLKMANEYCLNNQINCGRNVVKTLGEVCKVNQGIYIKSDMKIQGEYPVYGGGNASYYINQFNREDDIIVAKDGISADCVRYEKNKFFLNHHGWTLICNQDIIKKYMFYYLQLIQPELLSIAKGTAQLGINQENFYKLNITIPSLKRQREIVAYCEANDALIKQLEEEINRNKKQAQEFMDSVASLLSTEDEEQENATVESTDVIIQDETKSDSETTESEMSEENETEKSDETISIITNPKPNKTKKVKNNKKKLIMVDDDNEV